MRCETMLAGGPGTWDADAGKWVRCGVLSVADHPFLLDHRVRGRSVMPGAGYLEQVAQTVAELVGDAPIAVDDVAFIRPLVLHPDRPVVMRVELLACGEKWQFVVSSGDSGHCAGTVRLLRELPSSVQPLVVAPVKHEAEDFYRRAAAAGNGWTGLFRGIAGLRLEAERAVALIHVPDVDLDRYRCHPALLDACGQTAAALFMTPGQVEPVVGAGVESVRFLRPCAGTLWCEATRTGPHQADLRVFSGSGQLVLTARGLRLRRLDPPRTSWLHEVGWERLPTSVTVPEGPLAVVADNGGYAVELAKRLSDCTLVHDVAKLGHVDTVVHMASLDARECDEGPRSVLKLVKALRGRRLPGGLVLVTQGAMAVRDDDCTRPELAAVCGLGGVLAFEQPNLGCRTIDLDPANGVEQQIPHLVTELRRHGEDQVALRGGSAWAPRLRQRPRPAGRFTVRPDASYLITGGLGGIGQEVAKWLVACGARHLLLLDQAVKVPDIDADVHCAQIDIADEEAVRAAVDCWVHSGRPPVRGVVHAAGVVNYTAVADLTEAELVRTLRPKTVGTMVLDRLFPAGELDFLALFSSGATVVASPYLGAYAAANAYLDAVAHQRRARGAAATVINWGFWGSVGMSARYAEQHGRSPIPVGMREFPPADGLETLGGLLAEDAVRAAVLPTAWSTWAAAHPRAARSPLLRGVLEDRA